MRVLVQAGHYPTGGGAPGEAAWTWKLAGLLRTRLEVAGVSCVVVGDWYGKAAPAEVHQDYALFVSLHYDAAIYGPAGTGRNTGCFADRAAGDPMAVESDRAIRAWEAVYPAATSIPLHNERRNANTYAYYGFNATSKRTPGILIEHGCGAPVPVGNAPAGDDAAFLHGQIDRVADADARAILAFLGLTTVPIVEPSPIPLVTPVEEPAMLTDDQARDVAALLWAQRQQVFMPGFAIPDAWLRELRAGRYRGLPQGAELDGPDGTKVQAFDAGVAVWVPASGVTWQA